MTAISDTKSNYRIKQLFILLGIGINLFVLFMIYKSPKYPVYDESYFYGNLNLLLQKGWSKELILHQQNQAPGPLYQAFYYILSKIGISISIHLTRYCSLLFLNLGLWIFVKAFKGSKDQNFWVFYFSLFSVPFVYPILGMGLTETISMVFLSFAFYFFKRFIDNKNYVFIILYSLFYSIALVGRQNFLVTFPCFLFWLLLEKASTVKKLFSISISCCSFLPLLYFISIWGGLVPPQQKMVSGNSIFSISIEHGLLGIAYYGMLFFLLNPSFFVSSLSKKSIALAFILSAALQASVRIKFLPFMSLFSKLSSSPLLYYIFPCLLILIGVHFVVSLIRSAARDLKDPKNNFIVLVNLAMAFSSFKVIHLFSSRYVAQSSYLAIGFTTEKETRKMFLVKLVILIVGSIAGLYSLYVYYQI